MDKLFLPTLSWTYRYLSMLGLKLTQISKRTQGSLSFIKCIFALPLGGMNHARFRPATQSSTLGSLRGADKAVDDIAEGDASHTHTRHGDNAPWWKVQLAHPIWVTRIEITNRITLGQHWVSQNTTIFFEIFATTTTYSHHGVIYGVLGVK